MGIVLVWGGGGRMGMVGKVGLWGGGGGGWFVMG